jgi:hypothetical protein
MVNPHRAAPMKAAWEHYVVGKFNLLFESLNSSGAVCAYANLRETDPVLWAEFNKPKNNCQSNSDSEETEDEGNCPFDNKDADLDAGANDSALNSVDLINALVKPQTSGPSLSEGLDAMEEHYNFNQPDTARYGVGKQQQVENKMYSAYLSR